MGSFTGHGRCGRYTTDTIDDIFFHQHGWTRVPGVVQLMVTTRCPMSCPHCLAEDGPGQDASADVIAAVLDGVRDGGVDELLLTGGEPLARTDLPAIIDELAAREISWSLNTALSPDPAQRAAIQRHPPGFVAVSLDGPAKVHDRFRGVDGAHAMALDSIRWFSSLEDCTVTAGTTVTRQNLRHLDRTLAQVAASGASAWGLHLLVPEGRAADRQDLALGRRDLDALLRFTARRRSVFPVSMADELGYCGEWEPLVRDLPLGCGAGRAMCVVLPDGEVVPCTTMDRSTSAGNVLERPLLEIWAEGFRELRTWQPQGKCQGCDYASACQGGCWLLRRRGEQCYKDVWQVPGALKTAASVAVCLGMLSAPGIGAARPSHSEGIGAARPSHSGTSLESVILSWYSEDLPIIEFGRHSADLPLLTPEPTPPAPPPGPMGFISMMRSGTLPKDPGERLSLIRHMAGTSHGSLAFAAVLLRAVTETALDAGPPAARPQALSAALEETLEVLGSETTRLRERIFTEKLDPYLARGRLHLRHRFEMSKAYRPPPAWLRLERDTAEERWGVPAEGEDEITRDYLSRHPWGAHLALSLRVKGLGRSAKQDFKSFGVFDRLQIPDRTSGKAAPVTVELRFLGSRDGIEINTQPGASLTWPDLVQTAWSQQREALAAKLAELDNVDLRSPKDPLLLPAVIARVQAGAQGPGLALEGLRYWLADFWIF